VMLVMMLDFAVFVLIMPTMYGWGGLK
jgi:hypothetical protein